jgi:hypothetical protein
MVSTRSNKRPATADPSEPQNPTTQDGRGGRGGRSNSSRGRGRGGINTRGRSQSTQSSESSQQQCQSTTPTNFNSASGIPNLTLDNYESQLALWSEKQLSEVLSKQTNQSNCIPPKFQEALWFHKMNYTKLKLMLALIGKSLPKQLNLGCKHIISLLFEKKILVANIQNSLPEGKIVQLAKNVAGIVSLHSVRQVLISQVSNHDKCVFLL